MRTSLRSIIDKMLGRIPGKTSQRDTATRMAMDADFSDRREPPSPEPRRLRERDNAHLYKTVGPLADVHFLQELIRSSIKHKSAMPTTSVGHIVASRSVLIPLREIGPTSHRTTRNPVAASNSSRVEGSLSPPGDLRRCPHRSAARFDASGMDTATMAGA